MNSADRALKGMNVSRASPPGDNSLVNEASVT